MKRTAPKPDSNPVGKQLELDPENIGDAKGQFGLGLDSPRSHDVTKGSQRIPWAEEPGGFTGQISDLVLDLGKIADRKILQGKRKKEGAAGTYYPGTTQTVIRRWNDLDTAAHEAAHALDDKFGIVADWATSEKPSPFDKELQWFWERGGSGGPDKSWTYNRAEGVAEFIRSYMVNPKAALERAPAFAKHFKSVLPEEVLSQIENVSLRLRQWHGSTAIEKTRAAIRTDKTPSPGIAERTKDFFDPNRIGEDFKTSGLDKARVLFTDEMAPFVTAAKQAAKRRGMDLDRLRPSNSPVILARGLTYFPQRFEAVIEFGMTDKSGKVVSPPANFLLRSLDRSTAASLKADVKDLEALLVSERTFEKADQIAEAGMLQLGEIEHRLNDRVQQRLESIEGSLRRNFELVYQRELGRLEAKAKARRAEGKSLPADAHNRHNKRIQSNLDKQKERIRLRHEEEIQRQLDIARQRELEMVRARMELAARAIEKRVMLDQSRLTGAGGGIHSATDIAAQSIQALQRDPRRYARLSVAAAAYRQWSDAVLQYMVQKGRLSGEAYAQIKSRNQQYAAMQRFLDDAEHIDMGNRGGMAGAKEVIKEFTGSTATIDSPLANLLKNTFAAMKEADRNEVMAAFTKLLSTDRGMYQGKPMNLAAIGQQVSEGTAGAVRVFIRGKPQYWLFEEGIDKAIRGMGRVSVPNWIGKTAQFLTNALRKGVTVMPGFQVRNRIRDTEQTLLVSPHQFKPSDWLKRASKEERRLYEFFGGGIGRGHYLDGAVDFFDVRDRLITEMRLDRRSVVLDPRRLAESYGEALRRSEMAPRMAEIRAAEREAFKNLKSEYDRQLYKHNSARNLIDFAQGGTITKFVSRFMTPFTNAQVQGQRSLLNMAADHPSKFAVRWLATTLIPHIAVYAWNRAAGDKNLDEYRQLPAYQRDMFYNLKVGDNIWLKIPKNFEAGVVGASLERSIDAMYGNGEAFEGYGGSLAKSFLPFDEGSIQGYGLSPISEAITNRDSFRDKPIVPQHEDALALELREYDKEASRFGVLFQQALGIDARKIDHLVRGFFGEAGQFALFASDLGRDDKPMRKHVALNRAFGVTAGSPGMSSPIVNEVMEMSRQSGSRENPLGELVDEYFDARTDQEADDAADALRTAARALKVQYETAAKGKTGEFRFLAIQRVLAKSPYRRKRDLHRKLPGLKVGESGDILGLPGGGPSDPLGLR
ncbi:MAG TPA: LPD38 domain-containing protein [Fimbriimonadaceae bacterium]|nr:LPD38 domain-containing protein [Fimbriimonadaceae bacterium]